MRKIIKLAVKNKVNSCKVAFTTNCYKAIQFLIKVNLHIVKKG